MSTNFDRLKAQFAESEQMASSTSVPSPFTQMGVPTPPPTPSDPSLLDRIGQSRENRGSSIADSLADMTGMTQRENELMGKNSLADQYNADLSIGEAALQMAGDTAGFVWDMGADALVEGATELFQMMPQSTQEASTDAFRQFMQTDLGQKGIMALNKGAEAWAAFADRNPQEAKNIEAAFNISPLGQAKKLRRVFENELTPMRIQNTGTRKILQAPQGRDRDVYNLIVPEETKQGKIEKLRAGNVTNPQGPSRSQSVILSENEWKVVDAVKPLGVSPAKTKTTNLNILVKEVDRLNQQTMNKVARARGGVEHSQVMDDVAQSLNVAQTTKPAVFGAGGSKGAKTTDDLMAQLNQILDKNGTDYHGLLKSRQEFDHFLLNELKAGTFGQGRKASVATEVHRSVRNVLNGYVKSNVPGTAELLDKQHLLFTAMDGLAPKAATEASTAIGRLVQLMPLHNVSTPLAAWATYTHPAMIAAGVGAVLMSPLLLGWKFVGKPLVYQRHARQAYGYTKQSLIDFRNEAAKLGSRIKDAKVLEAYRADMKVLASMIADFETDDDTNG